MTQSDIRMGGLTAPHVVSTIEQLQEAVRIIQSFGHFAFDVETRGVVERHSDVMAWIEQEWKEHVSSLKSKSDDIIARAHENITNKWRTTIALDPMRNEVFWIGLATEGHSWVVPMGHPNGEIIVPEERGDGSTIPPEGYRKILASGKESMAKSRYFIPAVFSEPPAQLNRSEVFEVLKPLFFSDLVKVGHNIKFDSRSIRKYYDNELPSEPFVDTMIMQHIVNENLLGYSLEKLLAHNFGNFNPYYRDGKIGATITEASFLKACRYVHLDARWTWLLYQKLWAKIANNDELLSCLRQDMRVLYVLMEMEDNGIPVDHKSMKQLGEELDKHPVVEMLIQWSELRKLKSTYVDGMLTKLYKGSLHPSFHLHRTATGRLSSSNPNLQNIPRDSIVRGLFVAPPGYTMLVADYDQIELRVMCMFSHDKKMSEFFLKEEDIHAGAAALVLGKSVESVTSEERQLGKGVNFLTAYGGGPHKLARTTGIELDHAKHVIEQYYKQFSGITKWKQSVIQEGVSKGYIKTMSGRRRRLPDLRSPNSELRSRAERQAVNAVVQGSAADICKNAMVGVYDIFYDTPARLLVQVHDELVVIVPEDTVDLYKPMLLQAMGDGSVINGIPLRVSCESARTWSEAKG